MLIVKGVDKVLLHMPKCGGSSVRWAVVNKYEYRWSCDHAPLHALPDRYKNMRRIGFCRNPVDWYVSKYYHDKNHFCRKDSTDTLSIIRFVSDNFNDSIQEVLPRLLDISNYFDMNPNKLDALKLRYRQLAMNKYLCRIALGFEDISEIKAEIFTDTLYNFWYEWIGLNSAKVYKMDDGNFSSYVRKEFPGVNIGHRNKGVYINPLNCSDIKSIRKADAKYFDKHNYL